MRTGPALAAMLLAVAASAATPVGPTAKQFNALRKEKGESCPPIRALKCSPMGDATELKCSYQEQFKGKPWSNSTALVAKDGAKWTWLDGGPRCSSLPQS